MKRSTGFLSSSIEALEQRVLWSASALVAPVLKAHPDSSVIITSGAGVALNPYFLGRCLGSYSMKVPSDQNQEITVPFAFILSSPTKPLVVKASKKPAPKYTLNLNTGIYPDYLTPFTSITITGKTSRSFETTVTKSKRTLTISGVLQKDNRTIKGHIKLTGPNQSLDASYTVKRAGK